MQYEIQCTSMQSTKKTNYHVSFDYISNPDHLDILVLPSWSFKRLWSWKIVLLDISHLISSSGKVEKYNVNSYFERIASARW